jgi:hypothetical protein
MSEQSRLAQWVNLLGQTFLKPDPRKIIIPEDSPPESMALLVDEIRRACDDPQAAEIEYWRLFASASGATCPPWQSVWSAEEGETPRLMGAAHHKALDWFREKPSRPTTWGCCCCSMPGCWPRARRARDWLHSARITSHGPLGCCPEWAWRRGTRCTASLPIPPGLFWPDTTEAGRAGMGPSSRAYAWMWTSAARPALPSAGRRRATPLSPGMRRAAP